MLNWANRFNIFCFLDNHNYLIQPQRYDCLMGVGSRSLVSSGTLEDVDTFLNRSGDWKFGHLSYELKNSIHQFVASKKERVGFPPYLFFVPEIVLQISGSELMISAKDPDITFDDILKEADRPIPAHQIQVQQRLSKDEYINKVKQLQRHIARGDCYEINFCQEFFSENAALDAVGTFQRLVHISPNPFSALYKLEDKYVICASPERFLAKRGNKIFSQPMKGTIRRDLLDRKEDERLKQALKESPKDRSENVMVVDMVRNDLAKVCRAETVQVDELFGVYTYPQVHQMISTITGQLKDGTSFSEIISATFPMGSMTGAPKHRVMELIDEYEVSARGIFSGSLGYISPDGDFDWNVVIRSIMYNATSKYLSYQVGSGITFYSDPEKEWDECLLKAEAIKKVLTS
jgi:para-aminobenzoate synthetase component I